MPELPEVETVARLLNADLRGKEVKNVEVLGLSSIGFPTICEFKQSLIGKKFLRVERRAKYIQYFLSRGMVLLQHLRMSGQMILSKKNDAVSPFLRVLIDLGGAIELRFNDQRRFGRLWLFSDDEAEKFLADKKLGPEPLSESFEAERFYRGLKGRSVAIKPLLLNQQFVAGLGNIYVDESLFAAGIHPLRKSDAVTHKEALALFEFIRSILSRAIEERGTSVASYRDSMGRPGAYVNLLKVYQKKGDPCERCGCAIAYTRVAQRGTHFCVSCQK